MPQGRRKVPFSGKAKKAQLQSKKKQKQPLEVAGEKGQFVYVVMCPNVVADTAKLHKNECIWHGSVLNWTLTFLF